MFIKDESFENDLLSAAVVLALTEGPLGLGRLRHSLGLPEWLLPGPGALDQVVADLEKSGLAQREGPTGASRIPETAIVRLTEHGHSRVASAHASLVELAEGIACLLDCYDRDP